MSPEELFALAVDQGLAEVKAVKVLEASCCTASDVSVIDFDAVKKVLCTGWPQMPKSCDGAMACEFKILWVEMKSLVSTWFDINSEYQERLRALNIQPEQLIFTSLNELNVPPYPRDVLLQKIRERFKLPVKYQDSCVVLKELAKRVGKREEWDDCRRSDEFIFLHDEADDDELLSLMTEDIPQLFRGLFKNIETEMGPQVQKFTPLMMTCTEFEEKYKPAQA